MAIVAAPAPKSNKAFYAHLYDDHGVLTMDEHGAVWFRHSETDALTLVTPEMYPFVMPHGEVGLCDTQLLRDGDRVVKCSRTLVGV